MVGVSVHGSTSQGHEQVGGRGQGRGAQGGCLLMWWSCPAPSLLVSGLGVFRLCCSAPVFPAFRFWFPPLSIEIFLTFTVVEEGKGPKRNICRGCRRQWEALRPSVFVWQTYFCLSRCLFYFCRRVSVWVAVLFTCIFFYRLFVFLFLTSMYEYSNKFNGMPWVCLEDICYWLMWLAPGLLQGVSPSPGHKRGSLMSSQATGS